MTESEARTKPISEVWAEFQTVAATIERSSRDGDFTEAAKKHLIKCFELAKPEFDMLRAVLLGQSKEVWDGDESGGTATRFEIIERDGKRLLRTKAVDIVRQTRIDDHDSALNMSAAYAFWAWELKQRNDESNG